MTALTWPDYIAPNSMEWWLESLSRTGGPSILGAERIIASPSARWRCTMTFRIWGTSRDPRPLLFWRALMGRLYGRSGTFTISPFDRLTPGRLSPAFNEAYSADYDTLAAFRVPDPVRFSDGAGFSDGGVFAQPRAVVAATAAAARGARSLTLSYSGFGLPQAGQYFGHASSYLYLADGVWPNGDGTFLVTFSPGLRAAVAAGDAFDFERPLATMRLVADDGGRARINIGGVADTTLDLVESF